MRPANDPAELTGGEDLPKSILVIDDDPLILEFMIKWLVADGFHTFAAPGGQEGLALLRSRTFDLVLLDLAMPAPDGFQVLATITRDTPELPVIIVSGLGSQDSAIKALRLGAWDFVTKPMERPLLRHQISKALERAELIKEKARHQQYLHDEVERRTALLNRRTADLEEANRGLQREIKSRQESEQRLRQAMEEWQTTFNSMTDFISIHDQEFTIVRANQALANYLGKTPEELIGQKCYHVFHDRTSPWVPCPHRDLLADGQPHTAEVFDPHLGIPLLITVSPVSSDGKLLGSIHVAKDISRQKRLEEERQKSANLESIAVLCGGLAHDFNNLLTALSGYIDLALMEKRPQELPHWLNHAKMVTNLAMELTRQLLAFSKGGSPILNHVSVFMLLQDSLDHLRKSVSQIRPEVRISEDIWPINGDHGQLRTVLRNIFYNAAEAMPDGGTLTIEATNCPKCPQEPHSLNQDSPPSPLEGDSVLITVTDQGVGISPEILGRIFDPYFTTSGKGATKGKGLGLALCYSIISKHHGKISVASQRDQGTTVSIYLPAIPTTAPVH